MNSHTILLVDDEDYTLHSIKRTLGKEYNMILSKTVDEAVFQLEREQIDIVITDLKLPDRDGIELVRYIKNKNSGIGIIILTAHGDVDSYIEAMTLGAFEYMHKPFDDKTLLCAVEKLKF